MRTLITTAATLLLTLAAAAAEKNDNLGAGALCAKCSGRGFTADIGTCTECKRDTSSGAFKLCQACGKKLGKCQACQGPLSTPAEKKPDDPVKDDGPKAAVEAWLKANVKGADELPPLAEVADPAVKTAFPKHRFCTMRFMQFPVARLAPEPLGSANLFAVAEADKDGKREVTHIKSARELQDFCAKALGARDKDAARAAAHGYCLLRKELAQDGFFKFEVKPEDFEVSEKDKALTVKASLKVAAGGKNSGAIETTMAFEGPEGAFKLVEETENLQAGMRPKCQSLKLNDPDPAVRAAAERDILIMGRNALPYLRGKVAETGGELREKIRALAARIEAGAGGPAVPGGQPLAE
jgi:hypothetical protein